MICIKNHKKNTARCVQMIKRTGGNALVFDFVETSLLAVYPLYHAEGM